MIGPLQSAWATVHDNARRAPIILALGLAGIVLYAVLALSGDLRDRLPLLFGAYPLLIGLMAAGWYRVRQNSARLPTMLAAALAFRLVAAIGEPALSDDLYRYLWDGNVQRHGLHPYAYAPDDPKLTELRDENWSRINHPELRTIYPPLSQALFLLLAALGAGPGGVKLLLGLADFGVVLILGLLLRRLELPLHRLALYAWNPLAVLETAGSGHVEPVGAMLVLLAAAWIIGRRAALSTLALGCAVHVKLLPALLVPGYLRRLRWREIALLVAVLIGLALPYALTGPAIGAGLFDYAERWEYNAFLYAGVQQLLEWLDTGNALKPTIASLQRWFGETAIDWGWVYRQAWPRELARALVLLATLAWIVVVARRGFDAARESFLVLGFVVLVSPTVHPWYVLWVLPFAVAYLSWGWLVLAALIPLAYTSGDADVSWPVRCVIYLPSLTLMLAAWLEKRGKQRNRVAVC